MQERTSAVTDTKEPILSGGRVRPFDTVQVEWVADPKKHKALKVKPLQLEFMHPILAEKLRKKGFVKEPTKEALAAAKKAAEAIQPQPVK